MVAFVKDGIPLGLACSSYLNVLVAPFPTWQSRGKGSLLFASMRPRAMGEAEVSVPREGGNF